MSSVEATTHTAGRGFLDEWEGCDGELVTAQEYLALLEADPETDELTIVVARNSLLQRKLTLVRAVADES
jgi:hypothetical protein